ncbi:M23 family metallopeptidase [Flavobacteriaceae bacterium]|nr:M23 family metallopeptidase [Flavobacteriaceae bacterium]
MKTLHFFFALGLLVGPLYAQKALESKISDATYNAPLKIPLLLAGNFGELRSDHFHSGLDIKTKHQQGLKVFSIADGYVSRIKISHWGYGKVLYVNHYNGTSSVYAHLQKFSPEIEKFVQKKQYANKSYTIQLFPKKDSIKVYKDSPIAYSGNSGGSTAPHLHFEMRKTGSAIAINPLQFPYEVLDKTPPTLQKLFAYPVGESSHVNRSENKVQLSFKRTPEGIYQTNPIEVKGSFYLGVKGYDRQELTANKNGIYQYKLSLNDTLIGEIKLDQFSFNETKGINTLIDYPHLIKHRERIVQLFQNARKPLSIFKTIKNKGIVNIKPNETVELELALLDHHGNNISIKIPVLGTSEAATIKKTLNKTPFPVFYKSPAHYKLAYGSLYFPVNSFYEDVYLNLETTKDTISVHKPMWAVKKPFTISFNSQNSPFSKYSYIAYMLDSKSSIYSNTKKDGDWLSTKTNKLGTYIVKQDSIPPSIRPKNFKSNQNIRNYQFLSLEIKDLETGINSYSGSLNGKWILMEYEPKTNTLTHHIGPRTNLQKNNELKIEVTDMLGNTQIYTTLLSL